MIAVCAATSKRTSRARRRGEGCPQSAPRGTVQVFRPTEGLKSAGKALDVIDLTASLVGASHRLHSGNLGRSRPIRQCSALLHPQVSTSWWVSVAKRDLIYSGRRRRCVVQASATASSWSGSAREPFALSCRW